MVARAKRKQKKQARAPLIGDPTIAANIRRALETAGMSPAELARRLQITPQAISQWLTAQTTPGAKRLRQIAFALKVSIEFLRQAPPVFQAVVRPPPKTVAQPPKRDRTLHLRPYRLGTASDQSTQANEGRLPVDLFGGLTSDEPDLVFMRVTGTDLEPTLRPGELVVADLNWDVISVAGIYLTGDRSFPILRRCELVSGPECRVRIYVRGSEWELPATDLPILGRVICKWLSPL
jgi:transcriptional regulator with XRE-family HTH domain